MTVTTGLGEDEPGTVVEVVRVDRMVVVATDADEGVTVTTEVDVPSSVVDVSTITEVSELVALDVGIEVVVVVAPVLRATFWRRWFATATSRAVALTDEMVRRPNSKVEASERMLLVGRAGLLRS